MLSFLKKCCRHLLSCHSLLIFSTHLLLTVFLAQVQIEHQYEPDPHEDSAFLSLHPLPSFSLSDSVLNIMGDTGALLSKHSWFLNWRAQPSPPADFNLRTNPFFCQCLCVCVLWCLSSFLVSCLSALLYFLYCRSMHSSSSPCCLILAACLCVCVCVCVCVCFSGISPQLKWFL